MSGRYNTNNALAAIAACDWAGLSPEQIAKHLKTFTGARGVSRLLRKMVLLC